MCSSMYSAITGSSLACTSACSQRWATSARSSDSFQARTIAGNHIAGSGSAATASSQIRIMRAAPRALAHASTPPDPADDPGTAPGARDPGDAVPPGVAPQEPVPLTEEDRKVLGKLRDLDGRPRQ